MTLRIAFAGAAALVLAASSSAAAPRPARPSAIPPAPLSSLHGRIVYSIRDGDIWVVNADGSKRRRITRSGRGNDFDPDFSPDGPRIVVRASWSPESRRIAWGNGAAVWVMNADGTHTQLVSRAGGVPGAWAPGPAIVFGCLVHNGTIGLCGVRGDGTGLTRLLGRSEARR